MLQNSVHSVSPGENVKCISDKLEGQPCGRRTVLTLHGSSGKLGPKMRCVSLCKKGLSMIAVQDK